MKISSSPMSFVEPAPVAGPQADGQEYNRLFESAVRDAAKDSSAKLRDDKHAATRRDAEKVVSDKENQSRAESRSQTSKMASVEKAGAEADPKTTSDEIVEDEPQTRHGHHAAIDALDRLLNGGFAAAAVDAKTASVSAETGSEEASAATAKKAMEIDVKTPEPDSVEPGVAVGTGKARGKVSLEVVHMETHFEPRSDDFVLVEGDAPLAKPDSKAQSAPTASRRTGAQEAGKTISELMASSATGSLATQAASTVAKAVTMADDKRAADVKQPRLSFGEALARLADLKQSDSGSAEGQEHRGRGAAFTDTGSSRTQKSTVVADQTKATTAVKSTSDGAQQSDAPFASMTSQVAGRVIDALGSGLASQPTSDTRQSGAYVRMTAGGAALKTLTIQLQPEALGRLDVSMRLVEGQLTLEIAATEAGTAKVLAQDREGLRKLLQHAGFSLDDTSITIVTREAVGQARTAASGEAAAGQNGSQTPSNSGTWTGDGSASDSGSHREKPAGGGQGQQDQRRGFSEEKSRGSVKAVSTYL